MGHPLWKGILCGKRSPIGGHVTGFALRMKMVFGAGRRGMGAFGVHVWIGIGRMGVGILGAMVVLSPSHDEAWTAI